MQTSDDRELYAVVCDGLDLAKKLWPTPPSATIALETHDWVRLRRVLLALPDLWLKASNNDDRVLPPSPE